MTWTQFHDMHSGGGTKEPPYERIYIEAPEDEAKTVFYNRFGHSPDRVSCTCCGADYSITESETFAQASGWERGCNVLATPRDSDTGLYKTPDDPWFEAHYYLEPEDEPEAIRRGWEVEKAWSLQGRYRTVEEYVKAKDVFVIPASEIKPEERARATFLSRVTSGRGE